MLMAREILSFLHSTIQILSGMEDKESIPSMGVTIPFNRGQCLDETISPHYRDPKSFSSFTSSFSLCSQELPHSSSEFPVSITVLVNF